MRARPGSLERPINSRLYRGTWLLVGIPLLIAAFSVGKPAALRAAVPTLPPAFDKLRAVALANDLAQTFPGPLTRIAGGGKRTPVVRRPGGESRPPRSRRAVHGDDSGARTRPARESDRHDPGRSPQALAVLAHLDNAGAGPARTTTRRGSPR
jgi:hypothetical protein